MDEIHLEYKEGVATLNIKFSQSYLKFSLMHSHLSRVVVFCFLCLACGSPNKMYEKGNHKGVLRALENKAKKGTLSADELNVFEKSINQALGFEREQLSDLFSSAELKDWKEGYTSLDNLEKRQETFAEFAQVDLEKIDFIDIDSWDGKFADKLYDHHIATFQDYSDQYYATENKAYAIDAYYELDRIAHFDRDEINIDSLQDIFRTLGVRNVALNFENRSFNGFELRHLRYYINPSNSTWTRFTFGNDIDYTINVVLQQLDKDERRTESQRQYTNDVIIRYDSTQDDDGNTVQVPVFETYTADVNEAAFTFIVRARVDVEIYANKTSDFVDSQTFADEIFAEEIKTYFVSGDIRAIPLSVTTAVGSPSSASAIYNYSPMIEELLRDISRDALYYINQF